jgi:hypothetical protein
MRKIATTIATALALTLAVPAFADEAKAEGGEAAAKEPGKLRVMEWLKGKWKKVAAKIKKKVGDDKWQQLKAFYAENIKPKVKAGKGRLRRAYVRFARNFGRAVEKGNLEKFLERAKAYWGKKSAPAAKAPAAEKPADKPAETK